MRILDETFSKYSLQRWVGYIGGTGALFVAVLNLVSNLILLKLPFWTVVRTPGVSFILILSAILLATSIADSAILRGIQVAGFLFGGAATAVGSVPGNITSALFAIYGIILVNEYANEKNRLGPSLLIGLAYMGIFVLTAQPDTEQPVFYLISATVFTGQIVLLFALVTYRQTAIRKQYSDRLESMVRDRTMALETALGERDEIIRELHHRVGNSLQLLESYVGLQEAAVDPERAETLKLIELRIHTIASVHAALHSEGALTHVPLDNYTLEQVAATGYSYSDTASITTHVETSLDAHIDFLLPFGVIITELVANAARHGRVAGETAEVSVDLREETGEVVLIVSDQGPGLPDAFTPGVGTEIVDSLVAQLHGTVDRSSGSASSGLEITARFPADQVAGRHGKPLSVR